MVIELIFNGRNTYIYKGYVMKYMANNMYLDELYWPSVWPDVTGMMVTVVEVNIPNGLISAVFRGYCNL